MTIPTNSNYPNDIDSDDNLFLVHDSLRLKMIEDYNPGDTSITVETNLEVMNKFPPTGLITLTEQCSDIDSRAISFYYGSKTSNKFLDLELLSEFEDVAKPKNATNVTQNVMAAHHNNLKSAIIAVEEFIGIKGTIDAKPFGETMEGRINFLRKLVLTPRAWFTADKTIGLVPLTVNFKDQSFRLGEGSVQFVWDFGDQTTSNISLISTISTISTVEIEYVNVVVSDTDGGEIQKTYSTPGNYTVKLTVTNQFGQDVVEFPNFINARTQAPNQAQIDFIPDNQIQTSSGGDATPLFDRLATKPGGPYTVPPTIRSPVNTFIRLEVPDGELNPSRSFAGEELNGSGSPIDPIIEYTWSLGDDLTHGSSSATKASYSVGGIYDIKLRTDTSFGAYRITTYENSIDIIERKNLWLFNIISGTSAKGNEYGLISETFKTATQSYIVDRNDDFLTGTHEEVRAKREFNRNTGFCQISSIGSSEKGDALLVYASGGNSMSGISSQTVKSIVYKGFTDEYTDTLGNNSISIVRPWNWAFLASPSNAYFLFGPDPALVPSTNQTYQTRQTLALTPAFALTADNLTSANYKNGANELQENLTSGYDISGEPTYGRFSVYRSAWKDQAGYLLRNSGIGTFFKISSFYTTDGTLGDEFTALKKLPDMTGTVKLEGQLVPLTTGLFFFTNSGSISAYNNVSGTWEVGGPSSSSASFRSVQDSSVSNFDSSANTMLATSDSDRIAYLSFDYSNNAFIKFNGVDLTFSNMGTRPSGEQWIMGIY